MELLAALAIAIVVFNVLARLFGYDDRPDHELTPEELAERQFWESQGE